MKNNRAKCRLCGSIIEALTEDDYVPCNCGEIAVEGRDSLRVYANDLSNILRVDDEGNVIVPVIKESGGELAPAPREAGDTPPGPDLLDMLHEMIGSIENLPQNAMLKPITHYDFAAALISIEQILRAK